MRFGKRNWLGSAGVAAALYLISMPVSAAGLDGTSNLACAAFNVMACVDNAACSQGSAKDFDLPEFIIVDVEAKVLRGSAHTGVQEVSEVKNMELSGKQLILQGVEEGRGWGISVNGETGAMSASVIGDAVNFMVFGACTAI